MDTDVRSKNEELAYFGQMLTATRIEDEGRIISIIDGLRKLLVLEAPLNKTLSPSEAIYGFCAWLTTRDEKTIMSASDDAAPVCDLINQFCKENKLKEPCENWATNLVHPSGECSGVAV